MGNVKQKRKAKVYVQLTKKNIHAQPMGEPEGRTRAVPVREGRKGRARVGRTVARKIVVADSTCMICLTCPDEVGWIECARALRVGGIPSRSGCRYGPLGRSRKRIPVKGVVRQNRKWVSHGNIVYRHRCRIAVGGLPMGIAVLGRKRVS